MGDKQVAVPTLQFNALYQLLHIYKHIFEEGIGLRQMMDYYYLLKSDGRSQMEDGAIYNIAGQRIQKMQKGINIVNGKKILK